jgi:hypothetical protein
MGTALKLLGAGVVVAAVAIASVFFFLIQALSCGA